MGQQNRRTVQAVEISCNIIRALQEQDATSVTEIGNQLGHSKSTIHCHLKTLTENELLVKQDDQYRLGLQFLDIAEAVKTQLGNYDIIKKETDALAESIQEVAQFGIEEREKVTYLYKRKSESGVETASRIGETQNLHSTGLGKAILASIPTERVHEIIDEHEPVEKTANTITSREELFDELQQIRKRGYAIDDEENVKGIRCVAAPVSWGSTTGAISVSGPASRMQGKRIERELTDKVRHTANIIEVNSRFQPS